MCEFTAADVIDLGSMAEARFPRLLRRIGMIVGDDDDAVETVVLYRDFGVDRAEVGVPAAVNLLGGPLAVIRQAYSHRRLLH